MTNTRENIKLTPEEVRDFLIDYGFTDLQLTKDSSVQGVPLTNEAYEKAIKEGERNEWRNYENDVSKYDY